MMLINSYRYGGAAGTTYLYDNHAFEAGWSLRTLNGNNYSGAFVLLRRSSDNAEKAFYPDGNGVISMSSEDGAGTSLSTWVSTNSAYVKTWYDQSGSGNHVTNTTTTQQPIIVDAGSLVVDEAGLVATRWDAGQILQASYTDSQPFTVFASVSSDDAAGNRVFFGADAATDKRIGIVGNEIFQNFGTAMLGTAGDNSVYDGERYLAYHMINNASSAMGWNGTHNESATTGANGITSNFHIGAQTSGTRPWDGFINEVIFYSSDQSSNRASIEADINAAWEIYWDGQVESIFDTYTGRFGISVRALNSAYTGPIMRVRDNAGATERPIYADYNGNLKTDRLAGWLTTGAGVVVTWYDQSGNGNNITNSTTTQQPRIYNNGVVTNGGLPAVDFYWNSAVTVLNGGAALTNPATGWMVAGNEDTTNVALALIWDNLADRRMFAKSADEEANINFGAGQFNFTGTTVGTANAQHLYYSLANGASSELAVDGETADVVSAGTNTGTTMNVGARNTTQNPWDGKIQEIIYFNSDVSANRTGIETDINTYYGL